jgi:hypothetical protein
MNTLEFFSAILPDTGRRCVGSLDGKVFKNYFGGSNEWADTTATHIDGKGFNSYIALSGFGPENSRTQENVVAVRCSWLDIDTQESKPKETYATRKDALKALVAFCNETSMPKPLVVSSGYGLHVYWPYTRDVTRQQWKQIATLLKAACEKYGLAVDRSRTTDEASVLRPVGTHNHKNEPKLVKMAQRGETVDPDDLLVILANYLGDDVHRFSQPAPSRMADLNSDLKGGVTFQPSSAEQIAEHCGVVAHVRDTKGDTDQPTWYHVLGVVAFTTEGEDKCHEWSGGYDGYSASETETKIAQAKQYAPTTCEKLSQCQPDICKACPHFGKIKSPIALGKERSLAKLPSSVPIRSLAKGLNNCPAPSSIPTTLDPSQALNEFNSLYAYAHNWGGTGTYIKRFGAGQYRPCTHDEIYQANANRVVEFADGKSMPAAKFWCSHHDRREYDEVIFDPEAIRSATGTPNTLNLWQGLSRRPQEGRCRLMLRHLRDVICCGDKTHFKYLLKLLAFIVQRPGRAPGVVLVLRSLKEGTGKTTVADWLCSMFGDHALMLNTPQQLTAKFNAHLEQLCLVCVNEPSWAGDKDSNAKIKSMITDPTIVIERKHGSTYSVPNRLALIFTTNSEWAISAGSGARRYFVLDVDERHASKASYFDPLHHEAENGGIEALLDLLLKINIKGFNPKNVPKTQALIKQQMMSLSVQHQWAIDLVEQEPDSTALGSTVRFGTTVPASEIYSDYILFAKGRISRPITHQQFGAWLKRIGLTDTRTSRGRFWNLPSAADFKNAIEHDAGIHDPSSVE